MTELGGNGAELELGVPRELRGPYAADLTEQDPPLHRAQRTRLQRRGQYDRLITQEAAETLHHGTHVKFT
jgi:hypothetical protein